MATPSATKKTETADPTATDAPAWTGDVRTERYCGRCQGMVNGNGCADPLCPIAGK
jgi:hypothetical protein